MKIFQYGYKEEPFDEEGSTIFRPRADIILRYNNKQKQVGAIVDSGSDISIIPKDLAEYLGLPLLLQTKRAIGGVSGETHAFQSCLNIVFISNNADDVLLIRDIPVIIVENFPDIVLGRKGVFDLFTITFEEAKRTITLQTN